MNSLNEAFNFYINEIHNELKSIDSCILLLNKNAKLINSFAEGDTCLNSFEQVYYSMFNFINSLGFKNYEKEDDQNFEIKNTNYDNYLFPLIFYPLKSNFKVNGILCLQNGENEIENEFFSKKAEFISSNIQQSNK